MPDVSVITPSFNRATLLPRVWDSLARQRADFEWIVIDDASTDNTRAIVESFGDKRIIYRALMKNSGVNAARNAGVRLARSQYVVFLDSDDELSPETLHCVVEIMDAAEDSIGIAVFPCVMAETGRQICELTDRKVLNEYDVVCGNAMGVGDKILVFRKEVFDEFRLPEAFRGCEQIFVYDISRKWKFLMINRPLSIVHRQADNLSNANSMIRRSSDIAKSFEIIIGNHKKILAAYPNVEFEFLKKALYRYGVAGSSGDVIRIYRKIVQRHAFPNVVFATGLMFFCLSCPAYFETWRINRLNRKIMGQQQ
jgi:glycosyltransferase involved in cell wall biosynthesis